MKVCVQMTNSYVHLSSPPRILNDTVFQNDYFTLVPCVCSSDDFLKMKKRFHMYFNYPTKRKVFSFAVVTLQTIIRITKSKKIYGWNMWHIRDRKEMHAKIW